MTDLAAPQLPQKPTHRKPPDRQRARHEGSITRRTVSSGKTRFEARVSVKGPDGKSRQISRTFGKRSEASTWVTEQIAAMRSGSFIMDRDMTVAAWLSKWLQAKHSQVEPSTHRSYTDLLNQHLIPRIGGTKLHELRPVHLEDAYRSIVDDSHTPSEPGKRKHRPVGPSTVRNLNRVMSSALADAERSELVTRNVARLVRLPKVRTAPAESWTVEEINAFIGATQSDRHNALWLLMLRTGLRRGEALGLRWSEVDLEPTARDGFAQARIVRQLRSVGGKLSPGPVKTENGRRTVALDDEVVSGLRSWRAVQSVERMAAGPAWLGEGEVFTREDGRVLEPSAVSKRFKALAKAAGLRVIRMHGTRHTTASQWIAAGVPMPVVSKLLGHADIGTTVNTYGHLQADSTVAAAMSMRARLRGTATTG